MKAPDHFLADPTEPEPGPAAPSGPGLPFLSTWRAVYLFVIATFIVWVVLLTLFTLFYS